MNRFTTASVAIFAAISFAPVANAGTLDAPYGEKPSVAPARYTGNIFKGKIIIKRVSAKNVGSTCDYLYARHNVDGGASSGFDRGCMLRLGEIDKADSICYIIIHNSPYGKALPRETEAHERAHCNGWPMDHPG